MIETRQVYSAVLTSFTHEGLAQQCVDKLIAHGIRAFALPPHRRQASQGLPQWCILVHRDSLEAAEAVLRTENAVN
jgi:hypothetical protein